MEILNKIKDDIPLPPNVCYTTLVDNEKGFEEALMAKFLKKINVFSATSKIFLKNVLFD
ncbi:hypothetical protein CLERM_667 [Coxiella-like endosymbiont]|nr:hypothetical protein CLERM_667 [Coxiella-like endosymbiont]